MAIGLVAMPDEKGETAMLTKTIHALTTALVLAASPALAMDDSARSAFAIPDRVTSTHAMQAYASANHNPVVRGRPRVVRPFTKAERLWFQTAQGYEDRF
ncbi:MAG: hypothetical protein GEU95_00705 [Rhizobiales bacterium]|nr:hypothetical protein [Hyphomicrobiales bacterium]